MATTARSDERDLGPVVRLTVIPGRAGRPSARRPASNGTRIIPAIAAHPAHLRDRPHPTGPSTGLRIRGHAALRSRDRSGPPPATSSRALADVPRPRPLRGRPVYDVHTMSAAPTTRVRRMVHDRTTLGAPEDDARCTRRWICPDFHPHGPKRRRCPNPLDLLDAITFRSAPSERTRKIASACRSGPIQPVPPATRVPSLRNPISHLKRGKKILGHRARSIALTKTRALLPPPLHKGQIPGRSPAAPKSRPSR